MGDGAANPGKRWSGPGTPSPHGGLPGPIGCGPDRKHHTSVLGPEGVPLRCSGVCASNRVTARPFRHAKYMPPANTDQKTIASVPPTRSR